MGRPKRSSRTRTRSTRAASPTPSVSDDILDLPQDYEDEEIDEDEAFNR